MAICPRCWPARQVLEQQPARHRHRRSARLRMRLSTLIVEARRTCHEPSSTKTLVAAALLAAGRRGGRLEPVALAVRRRRRRSGNGCCNRSQRAGARCCTGTTPWCRRSEVRQARQVAVHGHAAGAAVRRRRLTPRKVAVAVSAAAQSPACAWPRPRSALQAAVDAVGTVGLNERDVSIVQAARQRLRRACPSGRAGRRGPRRARRWPRCCTRLAGGAARVPGGGHRRRGRWRRRRARG